MTVWGGLNKGIISKGVGQAKEEGLVQWFSNLTVHQNHPEDLLKHTHCRTPSLEGLITRYGAGLGVYNSKFPGDADFAGPVMTLWKSLA